MFFKIFFVDFYGKMNINSVTLKNKNKLFIKGPAGRQKKAIKPFDSLNINDFGNKLYERNLDRSLPKKLSKKEQEKC